MKLRRTKKLCHFLGHPLCTFNAITFTFGEDSMLSSSEALVSFVPMRKFNAINWSSCNIIR